MISRQTFTKFSVLVSIFLTGLGHGVRLRCRNPVAREVPGGMIAAGPSDAVCITGELLFYGGILVFTVSMVYLYRLKSGGLVENVKLLVKEPYLFYGDQRRKVENWLMIGVSSVLLTQAISYYDFVYGSKSVLLVAGAEFLIFEGLIAHLISVALGISASIFALATVTHGAAFLTGNKGFRKTFAPFMYSLTVFPLIQLLDLFDGSMIVVLQIGLLLLAGWIALYGTYSNHTRKNPE